MARQETVIRAAIHDEKSRSKAMRAAAKMEGVMSVAFVRERNHLVVTGVGIDSVELTRSLRKIFGCADIVRVRNVMNSECGETETSTQHDFGQNTFLNYPTQSYHRPSYNYMPVPVHDADPPMCSIM